MLKPEYLPCTIARHVSHQRYGRDRTPARSASAALAERTDKIRIVSNNLSDPVQSGLSDGSKLSRNIIGFIVLIDAKGIAYLDLALSRFDIM
jgi:hypothetical protein